jgi:hypothetical protein
MEQSELLQFLVRALERLNLKYLITGSTVTIFYGEPRFTNDIDVVVQLPANTIREFCSQFPPGDFYVSEDAATDAVRHRSQFNIIHPGSGLKIDVIVPAMTEFDRARFGRAVRVQAGSDWGASFATPEDAIIKKMEYFREGRSEKHLRDIAGVLKTSGGQLDLKYIEQWADKLKLSDIWQAIQASAEGH